MRDAALDHPHPQTPLLDAPSHRVAAKGGEISKRAANVLHRGRLKRDDRRDVVHHARARFPTGIVADVVAHDGGSPGAPNGSSGNPCTPHDQFRRLPSSPTSVVYRFVAWTEGRGSSRGRSDNGDHAEPLLKAGDAPMPSPRYNRARPPSRTCRRVKRATHSQAANRPSVTVVA